MIIFLFYAFHLLRYYFMSFLRFHSFCAFLVKFIPKYFVILVCCVEWNVLSHLYFRVLILIVEKVLICIYFVLYMITNPKSLVYSQLLKIDSLVFVPSSPPCQCLFLYFSVHKLLRPLAFKVVYLCP